MSNQKEAKDWEKQCEELIRVYPAMGEFLRNWEGESGSKRAFRGQLCSLISTITKDRHYLTTSIVDIMRALCSSLEEDFLMALRFLYYVKAKPVIPDLMYDAAEKEYLARPEVEDTPLMNPGSDNAADYPDHVRALAFYLSMMGWERGQEAGKAQAKPPEAPKTPSSRPVATSKPKSKGKTAGFVEAAYVGDLFEDEMFPK